MSSFFNLAPIPLYAEGILRSLVADKSAKSFRKKLIRAMRRFLRRHMGKHMTEAQFSQMFTKEFIWDYTLSVGMDIVGSAQIMMDLDTKCPPPLGSYPLTWTEAVAGAVRYMSWKWHCTRMTRDDFDRDYPYSLFMDYVVKNRLDEL